MNPYRANLVVLAGTGDRNNRLFSLSRGEFHGTAFCLAPNLFVTAAHVYEAAVATGAVALGRLDPRDTHVQLVEDAEVFGDVDLALMLCPNLDADVLPFNFDRLEWLTDVLCFGFAFGSELSAKEGQPHVYHLRAFRGYVVVRRGLTQLPGVPPGYEISFPPPPGLSGAALLVPQAGDPAVTGVVLTHHTAELAGRRMDLGLAVDSEELLTIESRIIGGSIAERVFRRERVPPRNRQP
jgi:hypothetical protein